MAWPGYSLLRGVHFPILHYSRHGGQEEVKNVGGMQFGVLLPDGLVYHLSGGWKIRMSSYPPRVVAMIRRKRCRK